MGDMKSIYYNFWTIQNFFLNIVGFFLNNLFIIKNIYTNLKLIDKDIDARYTNAETFYDFLKFIKKCFWFTNNIPLKKG